MLNTEIQIEQKDRNLTETFAIFNLVRNAPQELPLSIQCEEVILNLCVTFC